jgi:hypothetical protein
MSLNKLHIFAKNRDAVASQKGYTFQQLKTLEDWIENRIVGGNEDIYCDYEDDILSRDIIQGKSKFKQIKLYSTDFSFSSENIKKAIAHFFTMYVKGEYSFDKIEFNFETNASVVKKTVKDNDADLLQDWFVNQNNLGADLLDRIRIRVKAILGEYIDQSTKKLGANTELKGDLQIAKNMFGNLKNEELDAFIRCIKWQFDGVDTNEAIEQIAARIENLIPKIPLPLADDKTRTYVALLVSEVYQRSIQDDPEDRKLTKDLLDSVLLNAGDKEDQLYLKTLQQFKDAATVRQFYPGEFQALINAVSYCRWNQMDDGHKTFWLDLLQQYIKIDDTPIANRRKAIYEYLFLKIGHRLPKEKTESAISEDGYLIYYYFNNWGIRDRVQDIEDDIVLLQLIKSQIKSFGLTFSEDDISKWEASIKFRLEEEVLKEKRVDRLCELLEMQGHLAAQVDITDPIGSYKIALEFYKKIPPLLEKAQYYSLARIYAQMNQMVKMLTKYGLNEELIDMVDEFMNEIQDYADRTGLRHKSAHDFVERGVLHIQRHDFPNYLKALELFHRAKSLWRLEYTKEGYILSLQGIAKVYDGLGMSYASKYYSLIAFWSAWHFSDAKLYKRLPESFGQIQHVDYKHGSWMNAIEDFNHYLFSKREFDERGFDMSNDENYLRSLLEMATILHAVPLICPEMTAFIESLKPKLGFVWTDQMRPLVEELTENIKDLDSLKSILNKTLIDLPLNDVGPTRNIRFHALGNDWHIHFDNNETMTPIGEEFVSFLQITLCEIVRVNPNIINSGKKVVIAIQNGHFQKQSLGNDHWIVTIPGFDSKEQPEVQIHYTYIGSLVIAILRSLSNLSRIEFNQFYLEQLLKTELLGEKALEVSTYQRVFRNIMAGSSKTIWQRSDFNPVDENSITITYPKWLPK